MLLGALRRFLQDRRGNISIIGGIALPILVGFGSLVAEVGHGLVTKMEAQRVADAAAYAGGLAYAKTSSTDTMTAAARSVAALNGIPAGKVSVTLGPSPRTATNQAVLVNIQASEVLLLAPVIGAGRSLDVKANSYAEIATSASACILALSANGAGVTLSGGTVVSAPSCAVASNYTVSVPCGTSLTAKSVTYNSTNAPSQPCPTITATTIAKTTTADPLANDAGVQTAVARVSTVSGMAAPSIPATAAGGNIDFAYSQSSTKSQATADGCSASYAGNTWTLTCPNGGTYNFGSITLGGGITVNFNTSGTASTTYNFNGSITNSGTALYFGPGNYNIARGVKTGGGSTTSFGAGTFQIGSGNTACNGAGTYSICNTSTLTFGGPSTFVLVAGIYNSGGSTLTLGSGTTNSFQIGASSDGNAVWLGGGSKTTFADATDASSVFQLVGNLNVASGGGSCLTLSAASQHDINGYLSTAGGTILGAGVYTVKSYIALGANGGGDVTCNGTTVGMTGTGVTLVTGASGTLSSGTCASMGFCVAAGYGHVSLTAPASGTTANLVVIGPTTTWSNAAGALFAEGASNTSLSGAFYFPYGSVSLTGGSSVGNGTGQCLQLIGSQVSLSGGTALASTCLGTGAGSSIVLVQ